MAVESWDWRKAATGRHEKFREEVATLGYQLKKMVEFLNVLHSTAQLNQEAVPKRQTVTVQLN